MPGIGGGNPYPFAWGGGLSRAEQAYEQLKDAVGIGGYAPDETGIDGLWRMSRAKGLAAAMSSDERALIQAFPRYATDMVPYYERILGLVPATGANRRQRVDAILREWYKRAIAATAELESALTDLDPRFSLVDASEVTAILSHFGRAFEAHDDSSEGPEFSYQSGEKYTAFPNFSTRSRVRVRFDVGYTGPLKISDEGVLIKARRLLRLSLPSDTDFCISVSEWMLGSTPIGYGSLGQEVGKHPLRAYFGSDLQGLWGADPSDWTVDSSEYGRHLTSVGADTPTYTTIDGMRALELTGDVILENDAVAAFASGTDKPFSILVWGAREVLGLSSGFIPIASIFGDDASNQLALVGNMAGRFWEAYRIDDAAGFTELQLVHDEDDRFACFSCAASLGDSVLRVGEDADNLTEDTGALNGNPTTVSHFQIGGAMSTNHFNLLRLAIVSRAVTAGEMEKFMRLYA